MKVICLFLILGFISCKTEPDAVYTIWYNTEYSLSNQFVGDLFTYYVFRLEVHKGDEMDFEFKIDSREFDQQFTFSIYYFNDYPSDVQILRREGTPSTNILNYRDPYEEGIYKVFPYHFTAYDPTKYEYYYLAIEIKPPVFAYHDVIFRINLFKYKYSNIKELSFNEEYSIKTDIFGNGGYIPKNYQIFIRLSALDEDKMEIQLYTHEVFDKDNFFKVDVCQYKEKPDETQVYYGNKAAKCDTGLKNIAGADQPMEYRYPFTTESGINYLSISIINQLSTLGYLKIYIYSEKGMAAAIIALIVILPILLIGAGVTFILRKCGYCRREY